jgi:hypothetical protein
MESGWTPLANGIILRESAYPMKHWLIPPIIRNLNNPAQNRFLVSHKRTRRIIEQSFGILKEKFPCLKPSSCKSTVRCQYSYGMCCSLQHFSEK